jgi:predicted enzyme involved in methoxymalonyl-ACP biosynthesis
LIGKSNQYNLTTRRYTEADVAAIEADPNCFTLQIRLVDRFGDNGMISVVVCRKRNPAAWEIDTWLMSCRVLGRRVQEMVLRELLRHATLNRIETLIGTYVPTERNGMVKDHYRLLGFVEAGATPDGSTRWALDVQEANVPGAPMRVRSIGFFESVSEDKAESQAMVYASSGAHSA